MEKADDPFLFGFAIFYLLRLPSSFSVKIPHKLSADEMIFADVQSTEKNPHWLEVNNLMVNTLIKKYPPKMFRTWGILAGGYILY